MKAVTIKCRDLMVGYKWVIGYENLYAISDKGDVYSFRSHKYLKPHPNHKGYLMVDLYDGFGGREKGIIHRMVAKAFIPNPDNKPEVDHIDTNRQNNNVYNLRWVTRKENQNNDLTRKHNSDTRKGKYYGEKNPNSKHVIQKDLNENIIKIWGCAKEICNEYNWNYNTFYAHLGGNLKCKNPHEYKGFIWIFYNDNDK